jgi:hypothetical protein
MTKRIKRQNNNGNLFFDLKDDLLVKIYEFDNTYIERFDRCLKSLPGKWSCCFDYAERYIRPQDFYHLKDFLYHSSQKITFHASLIEPDSHRRAFIVFQSCSHHAFDALFTSLRITLRTIGRDPDSFQTLQKHEIDSLIDDLVTAIGEPDVLCRPTIDLVIHVDMAYTYGNIQASVGSSHGFGFDDCTLLLFERSVFEIPCMVTFF